MEMEKNGVSQKIHRPGPHHLAALVTALVTTLAIFVAAGCSLDETERPQGRVTVTDTVAGAQGTCQVVLSVTNTGSVPISGLDILLSVKSDTRQYFHRVAEVGNLPPGDTLGIVKDIALDSPDETVDPSATVVESWSFS
jgi:hypothetical protein